VKRVTAARLVAIELGFRIWLRGAAGLEVQLLKPVENAAHVAVRIVHAQGCLLDFAECVLGKFDNLGGVTGFEQFGNGIHDLINAGGKIAGGSVVHETAGPRRTVQGVANGGDVCAFAGGFGGLEEQTFAEMLVARDLIEQHFHEFLLVSLVQPRASVVERDNGSAAGF